MTIDEFLKPAVKSSRIQFTKSVTKNGIDLIIDFWNGQTHWLNKDKMKKFIANHELPHMPIAVQLQGTGEPQWLTLPQTF